MLLCQERCMTRDFEVLVVCCGPDQVHHFLVILRMSVSTKAPRSHIQSFAFTLPFGSEYQLNKFSVDLMLTHVY